VVSLAFLEVLLSRAVPGYEGSSGRPSGRFLPDWGESEERYPGGGGSASAGSVLPGRVSFG